MSNYTANYPESFTPHSQNSNAASSVKVSPVYAKMADIDHELSTLCDRLSLLTDRLTPVLTPQSIGEANGEKIAPVPSMSPLAATLEGYATHLRYMDAQVSGILQRLES